MGLDIYFKCSNKDNDDDKVTTLYHTKRFWAICSWISKHVNADSQLEDDDQSIFISCQITENQLKNLASTLELLDYDNCQTIFPICNKEAYPIISYHQDYWGQVDNLKQFVSILLELFDFEKKELFFCADS
jgi:hypothetical protein